MVKQVRKTINVTRKAKMAKIDSDERGARSNALALAIKALDAAPELVAKQPTGANAGMVLINMAEEIRKYLNPESFKD